MTMIAAYHLEIGSKTIPRGNKYTLGSRILADGPYLEVNMLSLCIVKELSNAYCFDK